MARVLSIWQLLCALAALSAARACYYWWWLENPDNYNFRRCQAGCGTSLHDTDENYYQCCMPFSSGAPTPTVCSSLIQANSAKSTCKSTGVATTDMPSTYYTTNTVYKPPPSGTPSDYSLTYQTSSANAVPTQLPSSTVTVWKTTTSTTKCATQPPAPSVVSPAPSPSAPKPSSPSAVPSPPKPSTSSANAVPTSIDSSGGSHSTSCSDQAPSPSPNSPAPPPSPQSPAPSPSPKPSSPSPSPSAPVNSNTCACPAPPVTSSANAIQTSLNSPKPSSNWEGALPSAGFQPDKRTETPMTCACVKPSTQSANAVPTSINSPAPSPSPQPSPCSCSNWEGALAPSGFVPDLRKRTDKCACPGGPSGSPGASSPSGRSQGPNPSPSAGASLSKSNWEGALNSQFRVRGHNGDNVPVPTGLSSRDRKDERALPSAGFIPDRKRALPPSGFMPNGVRRSFDSHVTPTALPVIGRNLPPATCTSTTTIFTDDCKPTSSAKSPQPSSSSSPGDDEDCEEWEE